MEKSKVHSLTRHVIREGDACNLSSIKTESAHLVCTSPPYGSLKTYPDHDGQLGNIASYERFLDELDTVWSESLRILVPGGRIARVVGDVCISRRERESGGRSFSNRVGQTQSAVAAFTPENFSSVHIG